jgi:hypothetical protein
MPFPFGNTTDYCTIPVHQQDDPKGSEVNDLHRRPRGAGLGRNRLRDEGLGCNQQRREGGGERSESVAVREFAQIVTQTL